MAFSCLVWLYFGLSGCNYLLKPVTDRSLCHTFSTAGQNDNNLSELPDNLTMDVMRAGNYRLLTVLCEKGNNDDIGNRDDCVLKSFVRTSV